MLSVGGEMRISNNKRIETISYPSSNKNIFKIFYITSTVLLKAELGRIISAVFIFLSSFFSF